ncbi:hypothetical protein AVEN_157356-1 [Araneus ventricosus]|uniref:Uncharacterized protein n=1 Tax=Araneus ventricosus TaxID=182803 RepID=A0A4Y2GYH6_ARAVE|nr:hypothetical protein AVEN_157356-1 [Araneus ventricosus]
MEEHRKREEYEERKRKDKMEFELQKIRLGAEVRFSNSVANQNVNSTQIKPKLELHHLMQKFNSDENDIRLYLIMFERLAKQAEILENTWKFKLKLEPAVNKLYGFENQRMPALTSVRRIKADIEVDNAKGESISIYVVPDDAQSVDFIIKRTWLDLPRIAYTKIGKKSSNWIPEVEPFRNFRID